jgi:DeoR/GlpR family transcriptional regulator of sugar metabolism
MGQAMCRTARRCVLLAESNELERLDLRENGLAESVHAIVTDDGVSGEARERLQRHGVEIVASEPSVASA